MGHGALSKPKIEPVKFSKFKTGNKEYGALQTNISPYENFHQVCAANNRTVATFLLKSGGADVNELDEMKRTPLHLASRDGSMDMFIFLLQKGADFLLRDVDGVQPLHMACAGGHFEIVTELLKWCNDPEPQCGIGWTPMHYACTYGHLEVAYLLLSQKCDINKRAYDGSTPLMAAALASQPDVLQFMADMGADVHLADDYGNRVLDHAAEKGHHLNIEMLINTLGADANALDTRGKSAMHKCCLFDNPLALAKLIDCGGRAEQQDNDGRTPLHYAAIYGQAEMVLTLVKKGANVEACDFKGVNALHLTCEYGHGAITTHLLLCGVTVDALNNTGQTPLHVACSHRKFDAVHALLTWGARGEVPDLHGVYPMYLASKNRSEMVPDDVLHRAPGVPAYFRNRVGQLHQACSENNSRFLKEEIEKGAKVEERDSYGETPMHYCCRLGHDRLIKPLLQAGARIDYYDNWGLTPLHVACEGGHWGIVSWLLRRGADLEMRGELGVTPLHVACQFGHVDLAARLIKKGAKLHATDNIMRTPLHFAAQNGNHDLLIMLLENGANPNAVDQYSATALHVTAKGGNCALMISLLECGANIEAADKFGKRPLHLAAEFNRLECVKELVEWRANSKSRTTWNQTPLHSACNNGFTEVAVFLLQQAIYYAPEDPLVKHLRYPSVQRPNDRLLLESEETREMKKLLVEDYCLRDVDKNGFTPLHYACFRGHIDCAIALIIRGARGSVEDNYGKTALELIRDDKRREEVLKIAEKMNRLVKQQMRMFNVKIPYEKKRETFQSRFLKYGRVEPVKLSLDEKFLDVADMVRRLGLGRLHANSETEKIIRNPHKAYSELRQRTILAVEKGYRHFAKRNYKEANEKFQYAVQTLSLFDWVGRKYLKINIDLPNSTRVLALARVSDIHLEVMLSDEHSVQSEEEHKTEIRFRTREVLAFLQCVDQSDVDMEKFHEFVPIIL